MGPFKNAKYGISNRNTSVTVLCDKNYKTEQNLPLGTLVEIKRTFTNGNLEIRVFDYQNPNIWDKNNYVCHKSCLIYIQTDFWPYMTAVSCADDRLNLAKDTKLSEWIAKLKLGDLVAVTGISGNSALDLECAVIRYKGMVPEIGHGMHFGLELSKQNSELPVLENLPEPIAIKYLNVKSNAIIVSANRIRPVASSRPQSPIDGSSNTLKASPKDLAKQLLCGAIQKDKFKHHRPSTSSTGLNIVVTENFRRGSLRQTLPHDKRNKDNKFGSSLTLPKSNYNPNESHLISFNRSSSPLRCVSQNSNPMAVGNEKTNTNSTLVLTLTPKNMDKNKLSSSSSNPNIVDNNLTNMDQTKPSNSHNENSAAPRHYTSQYDFGDNISIGTTNTYRKPATIRKALKKSVMSLDERDLIVIDNKDIDTTNAAKNVIVIENVQEKKRNPVYKQEVDLIELLGGNWPDAAGDNLAPILNTDKKLKDRIDNKAILHHTTERNKSMNPLSHFVNERKSVTLEKKTKDVVSRLDKINNDPFGNLGTTNSAPSGLYNSQKNIKEVAEYTPEASAGCYYPGSGGTQTVSSPPRPLSPPSPIDLGIIGDLDSDLGVGSMVEINIESGDPLYGVVRWIGQFSGSSESPSSPIAGIELEDDHPHLSRTLTDGSFNGRRLFECGVDRALFIPLSQCQQDSRFQDIITSPDSSNDQLIDEENAMHIRQDYDTIKSKAAGASSENDPAKMFGQVDCPIVPGNVPPLNKTSDLESVCGKFRGIQGHHNSCYLDATLFSMFTFTSVFDALLFRPPGPQDSIHYEEVQKVLREEIVNPLRQNLYVRADRVMKLRTLLEKLSSVTGLTCEEKDPEEFLNSLLAQILRADPFLKLSSGQETFHYQLFVEKDEHLKLPSVQQLFEQSFLASDIKLKEVPACLIIQMPRFGKAYKMYPRILPSQLLDVTDIIEDSPRQCTVCGKLAQFECRECFGQCGAGLESTAFCDVCLNTAHAHAKRSKHKPKPLSVPVDFTIMAEHCIVPRLYMELFAVVCIETSHYVAFVKAGSGHEAPWCFFDSMADRKGEQNGYNIPEMVSVPDLPIWLSDEGARALNEEIPNDRQLPEHAKRLLCDAYMCMYQSPDVMMYR